MGIVFMDGKLFDAENLTYDGNVTYRMKNGSTDFCDSFKYDQDRIREAYNNSRARDGFADLVARAKNQGFRPATLSELFSAAGYGHDFQDIHTWQGMCWVKITE